MSMNLSDYYCESILLWLVNYDLAMVGQLIRSAMDSLDLTMTCSTCLFSGTGIFTIQKHDSRDCDSCKYSIRFLVTLLYMKLCNII